MVIQMNAERLRTIAHLRAFVANWPQEDHFVWEGDSSERDRARYLHIERTLRRFTYIRQPRTDKSAILDYLRLSSGYSRAQLTRLVKQWCDAPKKPVGQTIVKHYKAPAHAFARKYSDADIDLVVKNDQAHGNPAGIVLAGYLRRAFEVHGDGAYERLSGISGSHLYNLRASGRYSAQRTFKARTQSQSNSIGIRKAPQPEGQAGYLRTDTVHQGDLDGVKGVYHINIVDAATQWQVVACVSAIKQDQVVRAIKRMMANIPFKIKGLHSDNGTEFVNKGVAAMLARQCIEQTKSRAGRCTDNALAESKNASVVRRQMGHDHIPRELAPMVEDFYRAHLNPWVNTHRVSLFPSERPGPDGKLRTVYAQEDAATPLERLEQLLKSGKAQLKAGVSLEALRQAALVQTDLEVSLKMQAAKAQLYARIRADDRGVAPALRGQRGARAA